jgi:hypothetical protein
LKRVPELESVAASASEDDELLLDETVARYAEADSDASRTGAFTVDAAGVACWAWTSKAVPAIRKLNAATRHAIPKRLRWMFIFLMTPF